MMGMRGRKPPVLSWHVKPAWNPNTWGKGGRKKKEKKKEGVQEMGGTAKRYPDAELSRIFIYLMYIENYKLCLFPVILLQGITYYSTWQEGRSHCTVI